MKKLVYALAILVGFACNSNSADSNEAQEGKASAGEVNVYTHRHYDTDKKLFEEFEKQTGIKVKVVKAKADELIQKMKVEGDQSPADILITSDAGRLCRAKSENLLQALTNENISGVMPEYLKDPENFWFGITKRARIIAYHKDRVKTEDLSNYEALTEAKWNGKVVIRSSSNIYNQSLMASLIAHLGEDAAKAWAEGIVKNMARAPKGNDRDQVKAVAAGQGDLAVINTYYLGKLLNGSSDEEKNAGNAVNVFWPNQEGRGTHINVSGMGMAKYAPNKENAIKLMEYLLSKEVQKQFAEANYEYPVRTDVEPSELLKSWGTFKEDTLSLTELGKNNQKAVMLFDEAGWK